METVDQSWQGLVIGDPMSSLFQKMKRLKIELRRFNKIEFRNIIAKVNEKISELADVQMQVLASYTLELVEWERSLAKELYSLM